MEQKKTDKPIQQEQLSEELIHTRKSNKSWVILFVVIALVVLVGAALGGFFGYRYYKKQLEQKKEQQAKQSTQEQSETGTLPAPEQSKLFQVEIPPKNLSSESEIKEQLNGQ